MLTDNESDERDSTKECFVILPIGANNSEVRTRSNHIFSYILTETLEPLGYRVVRADQIDHSGQITTQIINHLLSASITIADLSDHNPNVFYELGVLHAFRRPFIHVMAEGQTLPFDVQGLRTIFVDTHDLDSVYAAKQSLNKMARAIEDGAEVDSPIHYALNLQTLHNSEDSSTRAIAEIAEDIGRLKSLVSRSVQTRKDYKEINYRDFMAMRRFIEGLSNDGILADVNIDTLITPETTTAHDQWVRELDGHMRQRAAGSAWSASGDDPWAQAPVVNSPYDDEPPF